MSDQATIDHSSNSSVLGRTPTQFISRKQGSGTSIASDDAAHGHLPPSPTDLILTRCGGWLSLLRILLVQFEDQTSLEKHMAAAHTKTVRDWVGSPSHEREAAFKTSNPIQSLMRNLRETSGKLASEHEAVYKVLSTQTLPALKGLEKEVHTRMTGMMADEKDRKKEKDKDEQKMRALIKELKAALIAAKGTGEVAPWNAGDPWITNVAIKRHAAEVALRNQSNLTTVEGLDTTFGVWEQNFIKNLKSALLAYTSLTSVSASSHGATVLLEQALQQLDPSQEWETYRNTQLLDSFNAEGKVATAGEDDYSGATDPFVKLVKEGPLLRKSKIMKKWHENWYCLTAAGWLHEFSERPNFNADGGNAHPSPNKSIWLKSCFISDLGGQGCHSGSEFHVTYVNTHSKLSKSKSLYKFSSNSLSDSEGWYQAISDFVPVENKSKGALAVGSTSQAALPVAGAAAADGRRLSTASTASDNSARNSPISERKPSLAAPVVASPAAAPATPVLAESQYRQEPAQELAHHELPARAAAPEAPAQMYPSPSGSTINQEKTVTPVAAPAALPPVQPPTLSATPPAETVVTPHAAGVPQIPTHSPAALAHEHQTPVPVVKEVEPAQYAPIDTVEAPPKKSGNFLTRAFGGGK